MEWGMRNDSKKISLPPTAIGHSPTLECPLTFPFQATRHSLRFPPMTPSPASRRVALVTGSSTGLGKAIAFELGRRRGMKPR